MQKIVALSVVVLGLSACSGETAKDATAAVVGKAIEVGKGTATGIAAGVEEGRKNAESADGAILAGNAAELEAHGAATLGEITASGDQASIHVLFENKEDKPLRITGIDVIALDGAGVVMPSTMSSRELTVPPKAKARFTFTATGKAEDVKTVRVFGKDLAP